MQGEAATMRALVYQQPGDADSVEAREVPEPVPGSDDVLVDVAYAGLNRADLLQRAGRYGAFPTDGPFVPGMEYSGVIAATGDRVKTLVRGDRVLGLVSQGAHAQRLIANEAAVSRVPAGVDMLAAAALPESYMTAWDALVRAGEFRLGQTVIVHAIGGSVGLAALALAKVGGGFVLGTSRTQAKLDRAAALGLDRAVLLDDDWAAVAHEMTAGRGADLVLDFVGLPTFDRNVTAIAEQGRIVQIGTLGGTKGSIAVGPFMGKRATYIGTMLRTRALHEKVGLARAFEAQVLPLFASGRITPVIDRVFPLDDAAAAHRYVEEDRNFGKVILAINPSLT